MSVDDSHLLYVTASAPYQTLPAHPFGAGLQRKVSRERREKGRTGGEWEESKGRLAEEEVKEERKNRRRIRRGKNCRKKRA